MLRILTAPRTNQDQFHFLSGVWTEHWPLETLSFSGYSRRRKMLKVNLLTQVSEKGSGTLNCQALKCYRMLPMEVCLSTPGGGIVEGVGTVKFPPK